jgi:hypothetical protein
MPVLPTPYWHYRRAPTPHSEVERQRLDYRRAPTPHSPLGSRKAAAGRQAGILGCHFLPHHLLRRWVFFTADSRQRAPRRAPGMPLPVALVPASCQLRRGLFVCAGHKGPNWNLECKKPYISFPNTCISAACCMCARAVPQYLRSELHLEVRWRVCRRASCECCWFVMQQQLDLAAWPRWPCVDGALLDCGKLGRSSCCFGSVAH